MDGLTPEQKEHVLYAARGGIVELLGEHPELAFRFGADDLTTVFVAGILAGVDATVQVFELIGKEKP